MIRTITGHETNDANAHGYASVPQLHITADDLGTGGASHHYLIIREGDSKLLGSVSFQDGPIGEVGVNGITHEVLLAVLIDRLRAYNAGPWRCRENACALTHFEEGLMWLQQRTRNREARGVEGTHAI